MRKCMKRSLVCMLLLGALILQGCVSVRSRDVGQKTENREELVLWTYYETEMQKLSMEELVEGFNESQGEYHLTWEYHGPVTEFNKKLAIGITQNQLPDMVILDNPDMPSYVRMDKLEDITEAVSGLEGVDEYFPEAMKSVEYDGRYYGLPFCCNNIVLIYNKDMLAEKGLSVPRTWEELQSAAEKLTGSGKYGFAMSAIDGEQGVFQLGTFMLSAGDDLEEAGGRGTLRAFRFIQNLVDQGWMSRECVNWSQNDVARIFIDGSCAMMENGPWVFPALDESGINYGIAAFPAGERSQGLLGGEDIAVIKGKNVEGSTAFLRYYSQADIMLNANLRANSLPPRKDAAQLFLAAKPRYKVVMEQMENCISRTSIMDWSELSGLLSSAQYQVITGESTPKRVCREIKKNMSRDNQP